ncbi:hypothetical protein E8E14_010834 [Neopestalotiopsis sp. 37M]|nr:hypothetical protein E8E14_010834 [Neopestalotiopsis sp. 37M]
MNSEDFTDIMSESAELSALYLAKAIRAFSEYYVQVTERLPEDFQQGVSLTPKDFFGYSQIEMVRETVLESPIWRRLAMLSIVWAIVEPAREALREAIDLLDVKIKQAKAADQCWIEIDETNAVQSVEDCEISKLCKMFLEALNRVSFMPVIKLVEPPTPSSLEPGIATFEYAKLEFPRDTIRVVQMDSISSSDESPIYLKTKIIRLQDNVPFATLSYTWGNPSGIFCSEQERDTVPRTDIPIICDGKRLGIGENLYRFLLRWRQFLANFDDIVPKDMPPDQAEAYRPPSEIWIDAICINQQDIEEKNEQVSIMGEIHSKSTKTWVWLGEKDQFSEEAFKVLEPLADVRLGDDSNENLSKREKKERLVQLGLPPNVTSWKWFAVFALLERQWFRRSWVLQEAALSRNVYVLCGPRCTQEDMASVISSITRMKMMDPDMLSSHGLYLQRLKGSKVHILDLWTLSRQALCYNPRDKVYAVASLANRDVYKTEDTVPDRKPLVPDYNKSVCEVYCDAAWFTLLTQASLAMLSLIGLNPQQNEHGLPSWVPDLSESPRYVSFWSIRYSHGGPRWSADTGMHWDIPRPEMRYQQCLGVQVSFVGKVSRTSQGEINYKRKKSEAIDYKHFVAFYKLLPPTYLGDANGQAAFEVLWRTIIADFASGISPAPEKYAQEFGKTYFQSLQHAVDEKISGIPNDYDNDLRQIYSTMREVAGDGMSVAMKENMFVYTEEGEEFRTRVFQTTNKRRLFIADTGHVGCGDGKLCVGDLVVVMAGYPIPFILRQGSGGRYKAIGEAYVHGIMFGEHAMKPDVKWESIILE